MLSLLKFFNRWIVIFKVSFRMWIVIERLLVEVHCWRIFSAGGKFEISCANRNFWVVCKRSVHLIGLSGRLTQPKIPRLSRRLGDLRWNTSMFHKCPCLVIMMIRILTYFLEWMVLRSVFKAIAPLSDLVLIIIAPHVLTDRLRDIFKECWITSISW